MKYILLLLSVVALLTAGCIFPGRGGGEYRERGEYGHHREYRGDYREQYPEPGVDVRIHAP